MKLTSILSIALALCVASAAAPTSEPTPVFEFDVWGSPPSQRIYALEKERLVQRLLFAIEEEGLASEVIATQLNAEPDTIVTKLNELAQFGLVREDGPHWSSCIPLYTADEIRAGEELGKEYARRQYSILSKEIPTLRRVFETTHLSQQFDWDDISLILVGGLLADFCVLDRIPFMPDHAVRELQLPLKSSSGKRWGYEGFEQLTDRFPSRKWKFYHNQVSKYSGGLARFGTFGENRPSQPSGPERWMMFEQGKILFALVAASQPEDLLRHQTGLEQSIFARALQGLQQTEPPAVEFRNGAYHSNVPILSQSDLSRLLPECDRVAKIIVEEVVRPHLSQRIAEGKSSGSRWPLPAGTYVRDRALQMLVEAGEIQPSPAGPVPWNLGVWGWQGFLAMHDDLVMGVVPDPFLLTPIAATEAAEVARLNRLQERVLSGEALVDTSTPAHAYLTRLSAYANSDLEALRQVDASSPPVDLVHLENLRSGGWLDHMSKVHIRRVPPLPADSREGDTYAVFTMHERGYEEAHVLFYLDRGWRYLGNTSRDGRWRTWAPAAAAEKVTQLKHQH